MSALQFELLSEQQARAILANPSYHAESYADRVRAQRRLLPVTSNAERSIARVAAAESLVRAAISRELEATR